MVCVFPCVVNGNKEVCRYCQSCSHLCRSFNNCRTLSRLSTSVKKHIKKQKL